MAKMPVHARHSGTGTCLRMLVPHAQAFLPALDNCLSALLGYFLTKPENAIRRLGVDMLIPICAQFHYAYGVLDIL